MKQLFKFILTAVKRISNQVPNLKSSVFTLLAIILLQFNAIGQSLVDKLKSGQSDASDVAEEGVDAFLGYVDIFAGVLLVFWIVQAFRQSRANTDDDSGEGFSIIKWGSWRAGVIIFYAIARAAIIPNIF